jgi:hypothetical protein
MDSKNEMEEWGIGCVDFISYSLLCSNWRCRNEAIVFGGAVGAAGLLALSFSRSSKKDTAAIPNAVAGGDCF